MGIDSKRKIMKCLLSFLGGVLSASYNVITDKSTCRPIEEMGWWTENHEVVKCEEKDNMCVCDVKCKKPFVSKANGSRLPWKLMCLGKSGIENAAWFRPSWAKGKSNDCINPNFAWNG